MTNKFTKLSQEGAKRKSGSRHNRRALEKIEKLANKLRAAGHTIPGDRK